MTVTLTRERPDTVDGRAMIDELERYFDSVYGEHDGYGASVDQMIAENVAFFVLRENDHAMACGGIKLYGVEYGELKRIYVRPQARGKGYGRLIVHHLETYARDRGVPLVRLETGIHQNDAVAMYERLGYARISPFGTYPDDPLSLHFEKRI